MEAWCSDGDSLVGLTIPRPPSLAGKARSSRSVSFGGALMSERTSVHTASAARACNSQFNAARAQVSRLCRSRAEGRTGLTFAR